MLQLPKLAKRLMSVLCACWSAFLGEFVSVIKLAFLKGTFEFLKFNKMDWHYQCCPNSGSVLIMLIQHGCRGS